MRDFTKAEKNWLNSLVPNFIVYYNKKEKGYCPQCKKDIDFTHLPKKQGVEVECPHCKTKGKIRYEKNAKCHYHNILGIIPCLDDGKLVLRYVAISCIFKDYYSINSITMKECLRETFNGYYDFDVVDRPYDEEDWKKCSLPDGEYRISWYTHRPLGTHVGLRSDNVYLYTKNMNRYTHKIKELKYIDFKKYFGNDKLRDRYYVWDIINASFGKWGLIIEYLQKLGMNNLARQLTCSDVNLSKNSLKDIFEISKEQYTELCKKRAKADRQLLNKMQAMNKYKKIRNDEEYEIYEKYIKNTWKEKDFLENYKPTLYKLGKYADTQKDFSFGTYYDYLKICEKLELDLKNDFVLFPDNLDKAHQMTTDMWNELQFDIKLNKYAEEANEYSSDYDKVVEKIGDKFDFETDKYQIVVPKNTREIGHEGYKLRHCVAQYINKVIDGQVIILFLRDKEQLDTPLYTMSIVNDTIDECKGYRNCKRPPEIEQFVEKFAKAKHLILNQNEHFAAIM